ncbi:MAG: serine protease [Armatimonadota bacterium]
MKSWITRRIATCITILACVSALSTFAFADEASNGRAICTKWNESIVRVQIVLKLTSSYGGESRDREYKMEVVGTVIDPSGLTLVSKSDIEYEGYYDDEEGNETSQITSAKFLLASGKEIPAKVVLRDKDLDLAFLRPTEKQPTLFACVDMKDSVKADILDQVIIVSRLGKVANRAISACFERIEAVVEKPRKVYSISLAGIGSQYGSPVFTMDGKLIGIVLTKEMPGSGGYNYYEDSSMPIVLPAEDILAVAAQAPEDAPAADTTTSPAVPAKKG